MDRRRRLDFGEIAEATEARKSEIERDGPTDRQGKLVKCIFISQLKKRRERGREREREGGSELSRMQRCAVLCTNQITKDRLTDRQTDRQTRKHNSF